MAVTIIVASPPCCGRQADLPAIAGKADRTGGMSKAVPQSLCRGSSDSMYTRGKRTQHGKPLGVVKDDQPDTREGQAGRLGVTERFVVCAGQRPDQVG